MKMEEQLIAPCGMNCAICAAYLARQHGVKGKGIKMATCEGCRPKNKKCAFLKKSCELLMSNKVQYCYECSSFPCRRLEAIDMRYQTNFRMSMVQNLIDIRQDGVERFLTEQEIKWRCPRCGGMLCCHNGLCFKCDFEQLEKKMAQKKNRYKWETV
jgi:hypothetical protein